ncbi:tRNA pseudouridine(38-40) synthase TruA [Phreatobacter stygius]|uniref:tRNA pseudouridine synthase A n=1 Tax=Phreatobacter stygius TaxID=1940610 RepID=A0A4D7AY69_9HYPH|nr:tRNA pseudouridine(38-40) synthase TruA [Phreatobacter stygius]QCI65181.1 tRNA pseudouridine(38-40) synthase TruA [Phreatobacter stygius]
MSRYRLTIEYDGGPYIGWQMQGASFGRSIQGALVQAIAAFCGEEVKVYGAGRTDTGVHALGQVAHIDLARDWPNRVVRDAINRHLKEDAIAVIAADKMPDDFDARFSAIRRHYLYRIIDRRPPLTLDARRAWWSPRRLDVEAMRAAAARLIGRHDFTTFRATECQAKSPVKNLDVFDIVRDADGIACSLSARSFLHNQVRSMVGTVKLVGEGLWTPEDVTEALEARDRKACGTVGPSHALYLTRVDYPEKWLPLPDTGDQTAK